MMNKGSTPVLKISSIKKSFGGIVAIKDVSTKVPRGCLKAIIGPNGAGKTTTFNMISGLLRPDEGEIWFEDKNITRFSAAQIAKLGIARTFQHPSIYKDITVLQNVMVASANNVQKHFLQTFLGSFFNKLPVNKIIADAEKTAWEMLEFVGLGHKGREAADVLTYGEQKVLELARALALDPKPQLILLDEPTAGLNSEESKTYMELLHKLKKTNVTIVMIEHRMELVKNLADEVLVLNFGGVLADDRTEHVWSDQKVINAYLGSDDEKESEVETNYV